MILLESDLTVYVTRDTCLTIDDYTQFKKGAYPIKIIVSNNNGQSFSDSLKFVLRGKRIDEKDDGLSSSSDISKVPTKIKEKIKNTKYKDLQKISKNPDNSIAKISSISSDSSVKIDFNSKGKRRLSQM